MKHKTIPYGRQEISEKDIAAVVEVLRSDFLTQGPKIEEFEKAFAAYVGSKYAVAVCNGTAGLHLSAVALGIQPGDKVITVPITFAASANCVRYRGGEVLFADIDPTTYLIDFSSVEILLERAPSGSIKGIVPVDFAGRPVQMELLRRIADKFGIWIIEDACHALGAYFTDSEGFRQHCGNGRFSELTVFSFHPVKHITTGEGGMVTTNNKELYNKLLRLRSHGMTRDTNHFVNHSRFAAGVSECGYPAWYMEMQDLGFNYRLTDIQAALGISQLSRASEGLARRRKIAKLYTDRLSKCEFVKGCSGCIEGHGYHLYVLEVKDRLGLYNFLRQNGILTQIHYIPCHLMPYYQKLGWKEGTMPNAEKYYSQCLSLPMYSSLKEDEQEYVIERIIEYYSH